MGAVSLLLTMREIFPFLLLKMEVIALFAPSVISFQADDMPRLSFGFRGNADFLAEDWSGSGDAIDVVDGKNGN